VIAATGALAAVIVPAALGSKAMADPVQWYWNAEAATNALMNRDPINAPRDDFGRAFSWDSENWAVFTAACRGRGPTHKKLYARFLCITVSKDQSFPAGAAIFKLTIDVAGKNSYKISKVRFVRDV
jgi:hypothetical protein